MMLHKVALISLGALAFAIPTALTNIACGPGEGEGEGDEGEGEGEGDPFLDLETCKVACLLDEDCDAPNTACDEDAAVCGTIPCASDAACTASFSGWLVTACDAGTACGFGVCIDLDGAGPGTDGGCGGRPQDFGGDCPFGAAGDQLDVDGNTVSVCVSEAICEDASGVCESAVAPPPTCSDDTDCAENGAGSTRCVDAQHCGCIEDADCADAFGGTTCYAGGYCGCTDDTECLAASADVCNATIGLCGCSGDDVCDADEHCAAAPPHVDID